MSGTIQIWSAIVVSCSYQWWYAHR